MAAAVLESNIIYLNIVREDERNKGGQVVVQNDAVDGHGIHFSGDHFVYVTLTTQYDTLRHGYWA